MKKMLVALASLVMSTAAMAETVTLKHDGLKVRANLETGGGNWQAGPVLVIAGSADTVVADMQEKMEGVTDGERVQFELLDGADHFFRDLWAEDLADMGSDFIESL